MSRLLRLAWIVVLSFTSLFALLMIFGPREPVEPEKTFDRSLLQDGVDTYLSIQEAKFDDIKPGLEKQVIWQGLEEVPTGISILYVHGFSASLQEVRPVPDLVADAFGANLVFTRLRGHARDGRALGEARASEWREDVDEALMVASHVGQDVVIIATSTGASAVVAAAAADPDAFRPVKGIALVSPNFGLADPMSAALNLPAGRYWIPWILGREQAFEPQNAEHARYWTTQYPSTALFPTAAMARAAVRADHKSIDIPALFYFSEQDQVVDPSKTMHVADRWGGPVTRAAPGLGDGVDPNAHLITGDVRSPANTQAAAELLIEWIKGL